MSTDVTRQSPHSPEEQARDEENAVTEAAHAQDGAKPMQTAQADAHHDGTHAAPARDMLHADDGTHWDDMPRHGEDPAHGTAHEACTPVEPELAEPPLRDGPCERVFETVSHAGPLFLCIVLALQVWPDFWQAWKGEALYCPAEARNISVFLHMLTEGQWLAPMTQQGTLTLAPWPVFLWFLGILAPLPPLLGSPELLYPLAAAGSALLALLAVWVFARCAGFGSRAAFAAGLILLSMPLFVPLGHFTGNSALAAALMLFSLSCFCCGWQAHRAWLSLPAAFLLAGFAGLAGGLFHLVVPLLASLVFLIWRGSFRRAQGSDALFGFFLLLVLLGVWLGAIILGSTPNGYLPALFGGLWQTPWPLPPYWWLPLCVALLGMLPWALMPLCVSWARVIRHAFTDLKASRQENAGASFAWISLVLGAGATLFACAAQAQVVAVALICLAAPLLGRAFLRLPALGNRLFFVLTALLLAAAGLALLAMSFGFSQTWLAGLLPVTLSPRQWDMLRAISGLPLMGALCLLGALVMTRFIHRDRFGGGLMFCTVVSIILCQPAVLMIAPDLGALPEMRLESLRGIEAQAQDRMSPPATLPAEAATPGATPEAMHAPAAATRVLSGDATSELPPELPHDQKPIDRPAAAPESTAPAHGAETPKTGNRASPADQTR